MVLVATGLDTARVKELMKEFDAGGAKIPEDILATIRTVVVERSAEIFHYYV